MFSSLGHIEFYVALAIGFIGFLMMLIFQKKEPEASVLLSTLFFGTAGIVLVAGILTPPDLISNVVLSLPATLGFIVITVLKHRKKKK